jgi:hypothetical protein
MASPLSAPRQQRYRPTLYIGYKVGCSTQLFPLLWRTWKVEQGGGALESAHMLVQTTVSSPWSQASREGQVSSALIQAKQKPSSVSS